MTVRVSRLYGGRRRPPVPTVSMDELVADANQFDVPDGRLSCTAASVCCARLLLDKGATSLTKDDLNRLLRAGARLSRQWHDAGGATAAASSLQCWTDVVRVFPALLDGYRATYETNGFFDASAVPPSDEYTGYVAFATALDALAAHSPQAGVLTAQRGSYAVAYDAPFWYVFDPHGTHHTSHAHHPQPATLRRTRDRALFHRYVACHVVDARPSTEFQVVLFTATPTPASASSVPSV